MSTDLRKGIWTERQVDYTTNLTILEPCEIASRNRVGKEPPLGNFKKLRLTG